MSFIWYPAQAALVIVSGASAGGPTDVVGSDSLTISESAVAVLINAVPTDSFTLSETATATILAVAVDSATLSESASASSGASNILSNDSATVTDSMTAVTAADVGVDSATVTDTTTQVVLSFNPETITFSESAVGLLAAVAVDSATLSEVATPQLNTAGNVTSTETVTLSESPAATLAAVTSDSLTVTDVVATQGILALVDSLTLGESVSQGADFTGEAIGTPSISLRITSGVTAAQITITFDSSVITFDSANVTWDGTVVTALPVSGIRVGGGSPALSAVVE